MDGFCFLSKTLNTDLQTLCKMLEKKFQFTKTSKRVLKQKHEKYIGKHRDRSIDDTLRCVHRHLVELVLTVLAAFITSTLLWSKQ